MVINYFTVIWFFLFATFYSQIIIDGAVRDTSYTLYSATIKIQKKYKNAIPVTVKIDTNLIIEKDLKYVKRGSRDLQLDLFYRKLESIKNAGVILVHGGGWVSGEKSLMHPLAQDLASQGYITATIEYRLAPEAKYPAAIHDIKAAVKWMRASSSKYNIDTNKIALIGCSAGGHLAAFVGATNGLQKFDERTNYPNNSSFVNAVIDIDGILDFTDPAESGKDSNLLKPSVGKRWLGASYRENPGLWIEASPISHISKYSAPICFINSSINRFHAGRDEMIEKLHSLNKYSEVHTIKESPHSFWLFHPWYSETNKYIADFLKTIFKRRRGI